MFKIVMNHGAESKM